MKRDESEALLFNTLTMVIGNSRSFAKFFRIIEISFVNQAMFNNANDLRECPELECSKTAYFCDFFLEGKKEMKLLNFMVWFYIYLTNTKKFFFK